MGREWKRGDLAVITIPARTAPRESVNAAGDTEVVAAATGRGGWVSTFDPDYFWDADYAFHAAEPRPLVVIDPEDREQVERLTASLRTGIESILRVSVDDLALDRIANKVADALRSLIAPPKPDEPMTATALVQDADGAVWIRQCSGSREQDMSHPWLHAVNGGIPGPANRECRYSDIAAVKILSEGVQ